jgi:hypothetical protein
MPGFVLRSEIRIQEAFETFNRNGESKTRIKTACGCLESTTLYNAEKRDSSFVGRL